MWTRIIPRCSSSNLLFVTRDICSYASSHGMKLNPPKCKGVRIDFLQYKPLDPVQLVEGVQKSALRIFIYIHLYFSKNHISWPDCSYKPVLVNCGLPTLLARHDKACWCFITNIKESGSLAHLLP